jgi:hypothetical protein
VKVEIVSLEEKTMIGMSHSLTYLFLSWGAVTAVLLVLVIYGNTLSSREEDQLYLNEAEQTMMASEQQVLIGKMNHLARVIVYLAVLSGLLLLVSAGVWVWIGLNR